MLTPGSLNNAFQIYWDEMHRCTAGKAYWALLHVTVCLPDICAALESKNGKTEGSRYVAWCDKYLIDPALSGSERWQMRCKVLHEGRASIAASHRYDGFSFAQPAPKGQVDHMRLVGKTLILDVGVLAAEMKAGVERWIQYLESNPSAPNALHAMANLSSLVQVRQFPHPASTRLVPIIINRSS